MGEVIKNTSGTPLSEIILAINRLDLDPSIKNLACQTFTGLSAKRIDCKTKSVKGVHKLSLVFYCVYMGYINSKNIVDPYYVGQSFELTKAQVDAALNSYSNYGCTIFKPEDALMFYIKNLNERLNNNGLTLDIDAFHADTLDIIQKCRMTRKGNDWIDQNSSRIICLTVIYFYLSDIKNLQMNKYVDDFEKACFTTKACIIRYYPILANYYNSICEEKIQEPTKKFCALTLFD